ncbi:MAG: hypothetical protein P8Y53_18265 [Pseudolabrys sp.]
MRLQTVGDRARVGLQIGEPLAIGGALRLQAEGFIGLSASEWVSTTCQRADTRFSINRRSSASPSARMCTTELA